MPGQRLPLATVREVLHDAAAGGVRKIRFYGGEPLLHPDLPAMIAHACDLGLEPYITSNGTHLGRRVQALYEAGLRLATIGFYGTGEAYDGYTQRSGHFARLDRSLARVRELYGGEFELQLNFVLLRDTCNLESLRRAWDFAKRHGMYFHVDLANYSTPFFVHDSERGLLLTSADRPRAEEVTRAMLALKHAEPERFLHSLEFIRSVPDWLLLGARMQVPCDAYELLWLGADGTLQLCDTALRLGNVHERPLRALLFTEEHRQAAYDGFKLNCPNCTCKAGSRIQRDPASARRYGRPMVGENV
jgi:cyclic pyranopterin phosphate synthase